MDIIKDPAAFVNTLIAEQDAVELPKLAERIINAAVERIGCSIKEVLPHIPFYTEGETTTKSLVRLTAMIQHDSIGDQLFVPLGVDRDGVIQNLGIFGLGVDIVGKDLVEECELAGRKMVVAVPPPYAHAIPSFEKILVLLYDQHEFKVNDVVELVGIYEAYDAGSACDVHYPYGLSAIHAICISKNSSKSCLADKQEYAVLRSKTHAALSQLGLDGHKGTIFMLALLSNISTRTSGLLTSLLIGYFPLNVRLSRQIQGNSWVARLCQMYPKTILIPLSRSFLEAEEFESRMDYETGVLQQGRLQIPNGTLLLIDERPLEEGKLSDIAAKNLQSLIHVITHQVVNYDFGGYPVPIPTNVPIISISHGKSILPMEYFVEVDGNNAALSSDGPTDSFIDYIEQCRGIDVHISDSTAAEIEADFLHGRSDSSGQFKAEDLGWVLNLSRLIASSYGCAELAMDHYQDAISLKSALSRSL